jgi:hypothetical protein
MLVLEAQAALAVAMEIPQLTAAAEAVTVLVMQTEVAQVTVALAAAALAAAAAAAEMAETVATVFSPYLLVSWVPISQPLMLEAQAAPAAGEAPAVKVRVLAEAAEAPVLVAQAAVVLEVLAVLLVMVVLEA